VAGLASCAASLCSRSFICCWTSSLYLRVSSWASAFGRVCSFGTPGWIRTTPRAAKAEPPKRRLIATFATLPDMSIPFNPLVWYGRQATSWKHCSGGLGPGADHIARHLVYAAFLNVAGLSEEHEQKTADGENASGRKEIVLRALPDTRTRASNSGPLSCCAATCGALRSQDSRRPSTHDCARVRIEAGPSIC